MTDENLRREAEKLIIAAQEQVLTIDIIKVKIDKIQVNNKYRIFRKGFKNIDHLSNECSMLSQKEYMCRDDLEAKNLFTEISTTYWSRKYRKGRT